VGGAMNARWGSVRRWREGMGEAARGCRRALNAALMEGRGNGAGVERTSGRRRGVAVHGGDGAPEVGDDPNRWALPIGEREREERVRWADGLSWAG
jgi:hypothetical protein